MYEVSMTDNTLGQEVFPNDEKIKTMILSTPSENYLHLKIRE